MMNSAQIAKTQGLRISVTRGLLICFLTAITGCFSVVAGELPLDTIVSKMASKEIFGIKPEKTEDYLKDICPLTSKGPNKYLWTYESDSPCGNMLWLRVEFQPGAEEDASWTYLQTQLALPLQASSFPDVYAELKRRISGKLGKPEFEDSQQEDKTAEWSVGEYQKLVLHLGNFENPVSNENQAIVLIEAVIAQGDE
jgi:hypothetical protein